MKDPNLFYGLALQGGGCLGYGQVTALRALTARTGLPLYQAFDLIGGTSVGSINGALIASGVPIEQIADFFTKDAPKIFSANPWTAVARLWNSAKYSPVALEESLQELLGDKTLADCKTRFIATAVDMASGRNVYFQSYGTSYSTGEEIVIAPDSGIKLWQVCRASSAAQSYFPGYKWNDMVLWDGGSTGCNAPDMLLYTEASSLVNHDSLKMLSIGAGKTNWKYNASSMINPGIATVLGATLDIAYACGETNEVWQCKSLLGDRHTRLVAKLGAGYAIDDASPATLQAMANAWIAELGNNPAVVKEWDWI